jgi:hypothetical protein
LKEEIRRSKKEKCFNSESSGGYRKSENGGKKINDIRKR